ncbi:MAG: 4-hydroxy-tetrahydrodipicolinate synthase [Tenuifilum sp.]|uniref:4-hydroxy-tetrahydrodipicolinate synthase n=1 Tax=Tenuifilum sp. TaxID=2760880 RepID=UPI0030987AE3
MDTAKLRGLGVAMVTPFSSNYQIDYPALDKLIEFLIGNGVNYLVVQGTTAETATLSDSEKRQLADYIVKKVNGRVPIVLGIGGNDTHKVIESYAKFDLTGIDAILSVTPYYNKPTQKGLYLHFKTIAQNTHLPIIVYNVPGRTGVNMTAETTLKLAHEFQGKIVAVKEASGNLTQMGYILRDRPSNFLVLSGDDGLTLPQISIGADGVISVLGNCAPAKFSRMVNLALQGNFTDAAKLHLGLIELIDLLFVEGNPGGVKAALNALGLIENVLRLPLAPVSDSTYDKIKKEIEKL